MGGGFIFGHCSVLLDGFCRSARKFLFMCLFFLTQMACTKSVYELLSFGDCNKRFADCTGVPQRKERVEVTFVDYGNKDYIETEHIRPLHPDLLTTPALGFHCCLHGVSSSESFWSPERIAQFEDLALEKDFSANIISYDEVLDVYHIQLSSEDGRTINRKFAELAGMDVVEHKVSTTGSQVSNGVGAKTSTASGAQGKTTRGIAQALGVNIPGHTQAQDQLPIPAVELKVGEKTNVSVVFVSTPADWWCQITKFTQATEQLGEQMAEVYERMGPSEGILRNLSPGSLCAALCGMDEVWYRATIEKVRTANGLRT